MALGRSGAESSWLTPEALAEPEARRCSVMDAHETLALVALLIAYQTGRTLAGIVARRALAEVPQDLESPLEVDPGPAH